MSLPKEHTSLEGMSAGQRRLVQRHLPLIQLTLQRRANLLHSRRAVREPRELFQEGCLALIEAVRSHDPARHGDFAAYAMARIHFAMSRFAHEHNDLIRVPFITQRRRKQKTVEANAQRHRPDAEFRVLRFKEGRVKASWRRSRGLDTPAVTEGTGCVRIGDLIRQRLDLATLSVVAEMKQSRRATRGNGRLVERCLEERWTVPEPQAKTPLREIAEKLGYSLSRVSHCEARFQRRVAVLLERDPVCTRLMKLARQSPAGMEQYVSQEEALAGGWAGRGGAAGGLAGGLA